MADAAYHTELAGRIDPFIIRQYLEMTGWVPFRTGRDSIAVFQYKKGTRFEQVTIPLVKTLSDCTIAMYQAAWTISKVEERPIEQVLTALTYPFADIIRIRITDTGAAPGYLPVGTAVGFYENLRKLIETSAGAVLQGTRGYAGSPENASREFAGRCLCGQVLGGGYGVNLVLPFLDAGSSPEEQEMFFERPEAYAGSLTRNVTRYIMESLHAIQTDGSQASPAIPVSAGFREAVAGICGQFTGARVSFQADWAFAIRETITTVSSVELKSKN